jgi:YHS domain-containing protein
MRKKLAVLLNSGVFLLTLSQLSFAGSCGCGSGHGQKLCQPPWVVNVQHSSPASEQPCDVSEVARKESVKVGNKICPVMGGVVDETITYEYEGEIYNFCCSGCISEFKKDPQKYIKKLEEELKSEPQ